MILLSDCFFLNLASDGLYQCSLLLLKTRFIYGRWTDASTQANTLVFEIDGV